MTRRSEDSSGKVSPIDVGRRRLLETGALLGASGWLSACATKGRELESGPAGSTYPLAEPEQVLYSTCLQCHVACQIKAKIHDGVLAKLSGNPYSPQNYLPHLPMETPLDEAARADGKLCTKGQAGIQTLYDPYRIRRVLKRSGPRGSGRFESISFEQFLDEVVEGGRLFAHLGEDRHVPGFREVRAVRDPAVARSLAEDAARFARGELSLDAFRARHRDHLDALIDPEHPDLGPRNNGFVFAAGRIEHGRKELMKWFTRDAFGSVNAFEHTTICEQSHHIAFSQMSEHDNHHLKPDLENARFVLFWGTGAFSANFGLTPSAEKVTRGMVERGLITAVVDPRLSNDAGRARWWLPVEPGADGALALAMARWIVEHGRHDRRYLENANEAAAEADGEPSWTDASHLVVVEDGRPVRFLRARDVGLAGGDAPVVSRGGRLLAVTDDRPVEGDLDATVARRGVTAQTAFSLFVEQAMARSPREYEQITGIAWRRVAEVARELTSHGKRACVELYRGPVQHTDGFYAGAAVIALNLLIGNINWRGGMIKGGGHWHEFGGRPVSRYDILALHPNRFPVFGPPITRETTRYESTSLFRERGYPAERPWYPLTNNVYQEIIPSMAQGYPYRCEILFLHKGTPALSCPAGHKQIEMLRDPERIPLFIACDIVIGETSMYADYILPDVTYLERWGTPHVTPDVPTATSKIRQPVVAPLTEDVVVDGEAMPLGLEAFLIALGKRLDLPGFGADALGDGFAFDRPEDWYLKAVANIAFGDRPGEAVPDADDDELRLFRAARRHLPASTFDEKAWRRAVRPDEWRKVVYVLNRGGRFAPYGSGYEGEHARRRAKKTWHFFLEEVAATRNSLSGEPFSGVAHWRGPFDAAGRPLDRGGEYPLALITYKEPFGGQSRTIGNYWGNIALQPENRILVSRRDAAELGLSDGERVRLVSAANPEGAFDVGDGRRIEVAGRVRVTEGLRPGVVAVSWHYGHWAYGSNDVVIDGRRIRGDERRRGGLCPNPVMAVDPVLGDVALTDPVGGSSSYFDTRVRLERVASSQAVSG